MRKTAIYYKKNIFSSFSELDLESIDATENEIDTQTTNALDIIEQKTQWLLQN